MMVTGSEVQGTSGMRRVAQVLALLCAVGLVGAVCGCGGSDSVGVAPGAAGGADEGGGFQPNAKGQVRVLVGFRDAPGAADEALVAQAGGEVHARFHLVPVIAASMPQAAVDGLRRNPRVAYIEPDEPGEYLRADSGRKKPEPSPPPEGEQVPWGMTRIKADQVWPTNIGAGVTVGIIDSGEDYNHEDLAANHEPGNPGWDFEFDPPIPDPYYTSEYGSRSHGTHVAGIVAAVRGNDVGVVGAAPGATIYALAAGKSGPITSYIVEALEWCADNRIRVAAMSFALQRETQTMDDALENCWAANVLMVCSVAGGGAGSDSVGYPARHPAVIAVAATDKRDRHAPHSNRGPEVELAAPGVDIISCLPNHEYGENPEGEATRMASPHVSGTAALVIAANPDLSNAEVREILHNTAVDLKPWGRDTSYGFGLVDALAAVQEAAAPGSSTVVLDWVRLPRGA